MDVEAFREIVWDNSHTQYRDMPWRSDPSFYNVLVSEIMLQQTQVSRVLIKFAEFTLLFPTIEALAGASLADVLRAWTGLGYNRRARYLHEAARFVVTHGQPDTVKELTRLPGVGVNTAGALMNYVYEVPTPYVETNIRTIYIQHFFVDSVDVTDAEILELVAKTIDREHPREWFWALMDYGVVLKNRHGARLQQSKQYKRQSPLAGSIREVRGEIIRVLAKGKLTDHELRVAVSADERFVSALTGLENDKLIRRDEDTYRLFD